MRGVWKIIYIESRATTQVKHELFQPYTLAPPLTPTTSTTHIVWSSLSGRLSTKGVCHQQFWYHCLVV